MDFASAVFGGSLALVRIAGMVFTAPVLGHRSIPFRFKLLLALVLTTVTLPLINQSTTIPGEIDGWTHALFSEIAIGIFLGLGVQIVFAAAQMTGTVISQMAAMQLGNGNDTLGGEGSPVSKLLGVLSIAAFVLMGGPEQLVGATINTFVAVPVGTSLQTDGLLDLTIELLRQSFLLTLRGVAPAMGAIMISTFVIGLISRNYPQIDLLNVGLTSNLCVMMLALLFTLGGCVWLFADDFHQVVDTIQNAIVANDGEEDIAASKPIQYKPDSGTLVVGQTSPATSPITIITPIDRTPVAWQPAESFRQPTAPVQTYPDRTHSAVGRYLPVNLFDFNQAVVR